MSGKNAQRGFICQTIIALIECFDRNDWDEIKLEPETEHDKVDIFLFKEKKILTAIQVKSSINPFGRAVVHEQLQKLRRDANGAESVRLCLVGDRFSKTCREYIDETNEVECYSLNNLASTCKGKLSDYIQRKGKGNWVKVTELDDILESFFGKLHLNNVKAGPLSREEFEKSFLKLVINKRRSYFVGICTVATILIAVLSISCLNKEPDKQSEYIGFPSGHFVDDVIPADLYSSEQISVKYNTAIELYNNQNYENAKACFQDAIDEQTAISGINNKAGADMYYMLGLSCIYCNKDRQTVSSDAEAALTTAKTIYMELQDTWGYVQSCIGLGTAYYEAKSYNKAIETCAEILDTITDCLKDKDIVQKIGTIDNNQVRVFHALLNWDYDSLYAICMASKMRRDTLNLLGKVYAEIGETFEAFHCFTDAIKACSELYFADLELFIMDGSNKLDEADEQINKYVKTFNGQEEFEGISIQSFDYDPEKDVLTNRRNVKLHKSKSVATILTNRAQCEAVLGYADESYNDCNAALEIWNSLQFSERQNISYTYNTLIKSCLMSLEEEPDDNRKEQLKQMMEYSNIAVTYDCELFGVKHWRTAYSYVMRAEIFKYMGDNESALTDCQKAYEIYEEYGDEIGMGMVKDEIINLRLKDK